jgi:hypothetical protein
VLAGAPLSQASWLSSTLNQSCPPIDAETRTWVELLRAHLPKVIARDEAEQLNGIFVLFWSQVPTTRDDRCSPSVPLDVRYSLYEFD